MKVKELIAKLQELTNAKPQLLEVEMVSPWQNGGLIITDIEASPSGNRLFLDSDRIEEPRKLTLREVANRLIEISKESES